MRCLAAMLIMATTAQAAPACDESGGARHFNCSLTGGGQVTVCGLPDGRYLLQRDLPGAPELRLISVPPDLLAIGPAQSGQPIHRLGFYDEGWLHEVNVVLTAGRPSRAFVWTFSPANEDPITEIVCRPETVDSDLGAVIEKINMQ